MNLGARIEESGYLFVYEDAFGVFLEEMIEERQVRLHPGKTDELAAPIKELIFHILVVYLEREVINKVGHDTKKAVE